MARVRAHYVHSTHTRVDFSTEVRVPIVEPSQHLAAIRERQEAEAICREVCGTKPCGECVSRSVM